MSDGYPTPEEAARGDIPERYARVLDVSIAPWGGCAVVLLETNEAPVVELYQVVCERDGSEWVAGVGGNGPGEVWMDGAHVATDWDERPDGSIILRAQWHHEQ